MLEKNVVSSRSARRMPVFPICGGVGTLASWEGLVRSRLNGISRWTHLFAFMCAFLGFATILSIAIPLVKRVEEARSRRNLKGSSPELDHGDYIARFSRGDCFAVVVLAICFAIVTAYLCTHPVPNYMKYISSVMLAILLWVVYRYLFTTVRFTRKQITVHIYPFRPYAESYEAIAALQPRLGSLQLRFNDGRNLNIWAGLGDPETIVRLLKERIEK
jgi:hypothetical protein